MIYSLAEPLVEGGVDVLIPAGGIPMLLFAQISDFVLPRHRF